MQRLYSLLASTAYHVQRTQTTRSPIFRTLLLSGEECAMRLIFDDGYTAGFGISLDAKFQEWHRDRAQAPSIGISKRAMNLHSCIDTNSGELDEAFAHDLFNDAFKQEEARAGEYTITKKKSQGSLYCAKLIERLDSTKVVNAASYVLTTHVYHKTSGEGLRQTTKLGRSTSKAMLKENFELINDAVAGAGLIAATTEITRICST